MPEIWPNNRFLYFNKELMTQKIYCWARTLPSFIRFGSQWLFALYKIEVPPVEMKNFWTSKMFRKRDSSTEGFIKKQSSINVSNSGSIAMPPRETSLKITSLINQVHIVSHLMNLLVNSTHFGQLGQSIWKYRQQQILDMLSVVMHTFPALL